MPPIPDPFDAFREKKKLEELEKRVRSSAHVKCPSEAELAAGKQTTRKSSAIRPAFDPSKAWIY